MTAPRQYQTRADVEYILRALYFQDFFEAQRTLLLLARSRSPNIRVALIRDFIVTYAKPFSGNEAPLGPRHSLSAKQFVPKPLRTLHREVIDFRRQTIAHTDFEYHRPRVGKWDLKSGTVFPITMRTATYTGLIERRKDLSALCEAVRSNIALAQRAFELDTGMRDR